MGGRKLRFDSRKNRERKRQLEKPLDLTVSIPLHLLPAAEFVVSISTSVYTAAVVSDSTVLHSRLKQLSILPAGWICECPPNWSGYALVIYKSEYSAVLLSPHIVFSIQVFS